MSEELVKKFKLETKNSKSTWDTNNSEFKTGKTAETKNLRFPQFTNKRRIQVLLDFLIENKFDFILSIGVIDWQGIKIVIDGNEFSNQDKNECQHNGKQLNDNAYDKHTGSSVSSHKNTEHLSANKKKALVSLMSHFEELLLETVRDYKEMEVSFDIDANKTSYHA